MTVVDACWCYLKTKLCCIFWWYFEWIGLVAHFAAVKIKIVINQNEKMWMNVAKQLINQNWFSNVSKLT